MVDDATPTITTAGPAAPTTRRREATRQRLLDAAAQVFAETGLDAASVEAICERAGYTRGAFYSNFESKEQLFLELSARTARVQIDAVRARVAQLEADGTFAGTRADALAIVQQVLAATHDERWGVLLMGEMRLHALRVPALAEGFLAQEDELLASVQQVVTDIARANRMVMRLPAADATKLLLTAWKSSAEHAVLAGLDADATKRHLEAAVAQIAELLLAPEA
jgi:AcrR family transcriptional regulator